MSWVGIIIGLQDGDIEVAWANGMVSKVLLSLSRTHSNIQIHMQSFNASGICLKDYIYGYYSIYTIVQGRMTC